MRFVGEPCLQALGDRRARSYGAAGALASIMSVGVDLPAFVLDLERKTRRQPVATLGELAEICDICREHVLHLHIDVLRGRNTHHMLEPF